MNRRVFLKAASGSSVAGLALLAGCSNSASTGNASGKNGSNGGNESGGQTATAGAGTAASTGTSASATGTNGSENATAGGTNGTGGSSGGGSKTVGMHTEGGNYYFDPIGLFVEKGTTVTFKDESGAHSSTAYKKGNASAGVTRIPKGAKAWNSDTISEGKSYDHTFETEGTYDYFCIPHKSLGMVGRIVVGSPGGPAEGSMPPDGEAPKSDAIVEQGSISHDDFS